MTVDFVDLAARIGGTVLTPGCLGYEEAIQRWASNAERRAVAVVLVSSAADVATTVLPLMQSSDRSSLLLGRLSWK